MKKYLLLTICFLMLITGCGKKSDMDVFNSVIDKSIDNLKIKGKIDMVTVLKEKEVDVSMNIDTNVTVKNDTVLFTSSIEKNTITDNITVYGELESNKLSLYMPSTVLDSKLGYNNEYSCWIIVDKLINNDISIFKIKKLQEALKKSVRSEDFTYIDKSGKTSHYKLKVTDSLLTRMYDSIDGIKEEILAEPINFDVYIKNNKIVKIEAENIEGIMKFSTDEEFKNIKKLSFSLELSDNKETVEISDDVKKRALTENAYKRMISINN